MCNAPRGFVPAPAILSPSLQSRAPPSASGRPLVPVLSSPRSSPATASRSLLAAPAAPPWRIDAVEAGACQPCSRGRLDRQQSARFLPRRLASGSPVRSSQETLAQRSASPILRMAKSASFVQTKAPGAVAATVGASFASTGAFAPPLRHFTPPRSTRRDISDAAAPINANTSTCLPSARSMTAFSDFCHSSDKRPQRPLARLDAPIVSSHHTRWEDDRSRIADTSQAVKETTRRSLSARKMHAQHCDSLDETSASCTSPQPQMKSKIVSPSLTARSARSSSPVRLSHSRQTEAPQIRAVPRAQPPRCGDSKEKSGATAVGNTCEVSHAKPPHGTNELEAKVSTLQEEVERLNQLLKQERGASQAYSRLHEGAEAVHRMLTSEPRAQQRATTLLGALLHERGHPPESPQTRAKAASLLSDDSRGARAERRGKIETSTSPTNALRGYDRALKLLQTP